MCRIMPYYTLQLTQIDVECALQFGLCYNLVQVTPLMIKIRLARAGAKKKPFYHITVADVRCPRDGKFIERIGFYNPFARGQEVRLRLDIEKLNYWVSVGAQITEKANNLLKQARCNESDNNADGVTSVA